MTIHFWVESNKLLLLYTILSNQLLRQSLFLWKELRPKQSNAGYKPLQCWQTNQFPKKSDSNSLKVSKSRKQIILSFHTPKNQRNFPHFFALASKSGQIKKIKVSNCVKQHQISIFVLLFLFGQLFMTFQKLGQTNVKNLVGFLGYEKTTLFAFEIY